MAIAERKKPAPELGTQLSLVFGSPKCGKSTLAAQFPDAVFLATEAGLNNLACNRWEAADGRYVINSWEELLAATAEVIAAKTADGKQRFKTIILDTVGNASLLCDAHICAKNGVDFKMEGALGFGRGAAMILGEIRRYLTKLSTMGIGVVLIAHSMVKTINGRTGTIEKTQPFFPADNKQGELYNAVMGMVDLVLYCDIADGKRVLRTKPNPSYDAGDRTGSLPDTIEMSYAALAQAMSTPTITASTTAQKSGAK
jgi:hypothetical protein